MVPFFLIESVKLGTTNDPGWTLGNTSCSGDSAQVQLFDGKKGIPYSLNFYKEDAIWKIDFTPIMAYINQMLSDFYVNVGLNRNESIISSLQETYGQLHPDIWEPLDCSIVHPHIKRSGNKGIYKSNSTRQIDFSF